MHVKIRNSKDIERITAKVAEEKIKTNNENGPQLLPVKKNRRKWGKAEKVRHIEKKKIWQRRNEFRHFSDLNMDPTYLAKSRKIQECRKSVKSKYRKRINNIYFYLGKANKIIIYTSGKIPIISEKHSRGKTFKK